MFKLILISLTFALSLATLGVDIDVYTAAKLTPLDLVCLLGTGVQYFILESRNENGYINTNFTTHYKYLKTAGVKHVDTIMGVCDAYTAEQQCSEVANNLPEGFDGKVWLNIDTDDSCWKSTYGQFLHYLEGVVATCTSHNLTVGILGTASNYNWYVSGDMRRVSPTLTKYPVWYVHGDKQANFDDYDDLTGGFGGWTQPYMKRYASLQKVCNKYVSNDFFVPPNQEIIHENI